MLPKSCGHEEHKQRTEGTLCGENQKGIFLLVFVTFMMGAWPGNAKIYFASSVEQGKKRELKLISSETTS